MCWYLRFTGSKTNFPTHLLFFQFFQFLRFYSQTVPGVFLFHDCPRHKLQFHDFLGLENETIKFHDFPGFFYIIGKIADVSLKQGNYGFWEAAQPTYFSGSTPPTLRLG